MKATKIERLEPILWDRWLLLKIHCEDAPYDGSVQEDTPWILQN